MSGQIFVNLAVKNLNVSKKFFSALGYSFDPKFTDENAACLVFSGNIYAMLLTEKFFKSFNPGREICDTSRFTEVMLALSCGSREQVDDIAEKAVKAGGKLFREKQDLGFMYGRSFTDPDGHVWEPFYMESDA